MNDNNDIDNDTEHDSNEHNDDYSLCSIGTQPIARTVCMYTHIYIYIYILSTHTHAYACTHAYIEYVFLRTYEIRGTSCANNARSRCKISLLCSPVLWRSRRKL